MTSKSRDRKITLPFDNDRLVDAMRHPVQAWVKAPKEISGAQIIEWVTSDKPIVFEEEEEEEEKDQSMTPADKADIEDEQVNEEDITPQPVNKTLTSVTGDDDDSTHTPKLSDVSDLEQSTKDDDENEDEESNADDFNDPSRHPAFVPHAAARLTDDEALTDSTGVTPQTSTVATPQTSTVATPQPQSTPMEEDQDQDMSDIPAEEE